MDAAKPFTIASRIRLASLGVWDLRANRNVRAAKQPLPPRASAAADFSWGNHSGYHHRVFFNAVS